MARQFPRAFGVPAVVGLTLLCWLVAQLAGQNPQAPPTLTLIARDARRPVPLAVINDQEFVALDDLATTFQLSVREEPGAVTVSYKGRTIVLNPEQTIASVAGRMISLPVRPAKSGGRLLVPLEFISRALAPIYDVRLDLRRPSHLLVVGDMKVPRLTITTDAPGTGVRVTVDATPQTTNTVTREADHLSIRFDADALDVTVPPVAPQGVLTAIRRSDPVTVILDLGPRFGSYRATTQGLDASTRLTLELLPPPSDSTPTLTGGAAAPAAASSTGTSPPAVDPLPLGVPVTAIRTVTIDPGHGGADQGAKGAAGLAEKALTLNVARRLKSALEGRLGLRVLMTREDDHDVPFDTRTALANNNKADLFISLHANASLRPQVAGASILVATFPDEARARQALEPQRVTVFGGGLRDIELLPWSQAQLGYLDRSASFAELLKQRFDRRIPLDATPIDRAPLRVLTSANMPAVLIEMGYLSNPEQEKLMMGGEFQGGLAQAIVDALVDFRNALDAAPGVDR